MKLRFFFLLIGMMLMGTACQDKEDSLENMDDKVWLHSSVAKVTDILVFDVTSPPLASRSYVYPCLAAYYSLQPFESELSPVLPLLNGWNSDQELPDTTGVHHGFAAVASFLETARNHIYSQDKLQLWIDSVYLAYQASLPQKQYDATLQYATAVAGQIKAYAAADGLKEIRTMSEYVFEAAEEGKWIPTPPNYMDPIEPNWNKLRAFTLDSAQQFKPKPPTPFDLDKDSKFYQEMMEVYQVGHKLTEEQQEIAAFWDCNPYVVFHQGHFMQPVKKITPGGHWMAIAHQVCKNEQASLSQSVKAYAYTSIALADAFISCWDEKYRSNYIRPETVINLYHDKKWAPFLQTPPFPEYTSGHSVISTAAAGALTAIFGDSYAFVDSTEVPFGLPVRSFTSFKHASDEAAMSRMYGGIHFRPAIEDGVAQGQKVSEKVLQTIQQD